MYLSKGMAASVWDFNVHADLLNLYAHRGFLNTGRESALKLKVDSGRETLAAPENWTHFGIIPGFTVQCSTDWAILPHFK